jgi:thymidylate synthase
MNKLDKQYTDLLQDILDNGVTKSDRTGTGTLSVFGRTIRHNMKTGFPILTTKRIYFKGIVTELLWFLRGNTNIKFLVDNDCHIWDGDAYKKYSLIAGMSTQVQTLTKEEFIERIKNDNEFAKKWGELGPIYGKQWRQVDKKNGNPYKYEPIDQIANLINDLKTNPDSRRLMVNSWNVGELDSMVLPPCHYGFQVYTRELSTNEREQIALSIPAIAAEIEKRGPMTPLGLDRNNIPTRAISLMWNQRSIDTFLGLPFNIASYGLLLEIIAKAVNMVPDELIGNLGDVHLYSNHIEQAKEQIGREMTDAELLEYVKKDKDILVKLSSYSSNYEIRRICFEHGVLTRTRQPYPLPTLNINTEFWPYEGGECGEGPLDAVKVFESFKDDNFCKCLLEEDIQLGNYQSHPSIKAPLSN